MKMSVDKAIRKARSLSNEGETAEAERIFRDILERFPGNQRALAELEGLLKPRIENPPQPELDALVALYRQQRMGEALEQAERLVQRFPHGEILRNIAGALNAAMGRLDAAIDHYDHAVALAPDYVEALNNRGNALKERQRLDEALASFDAALRLKPDYADAYNNRGLALTKLKRLDEALASFDKAIQLQPGRAEMLNNRGNALAALNRREDALADYDKAVALRPDYADAHVNRGNMLKALRRREEALASYDKAIELAPSRAEAHNNRGVVLKELKRAEDARLSFEKALELKPDFAGALSELLYLEAHMCRWSNIERGTELSQLALSGRAIPPFHMLNIDDDPEHQLAYSRHWTQERYGNGLPAPARPAAHHDKIRIGYFSADFHNHATMYLMARMFELHDKGRFEIHAFSYGVNVQDKMRARLLDAVDQFHDVGELSDQEIAQLSRRQEIDIAIDLKGHTETTRSGIFAYRPAAIQVAYLGYPGTMGADFIDYLIADEVVIPQESRRFYSEKILYLPNCYQVNDNQRAMSDKVFMRAECGLPEDGFVFCSFNNNYKITPVEFDIWMRLLDQVESSVLWLLEDNPWAAENLRREAQARGIDPARLIFAERMPLPSHLARQRCADLFLDTFNVNAHTTASDALWAGLPLVTKLGDSFVARVAGSLLHSVGLPELVTETAQDYEALALDLARNPERLAAIRTQLADSHASAPLFDTERYTRDIERLFETVYHDQMAQLEPAL